MIFVGMKNDQPELIVYPGKVNEKHSKNGESDPRGISFFKRNDEI